MNDQLCHLIVEGQPGRERQDGASFKPLYEPKNSGAQAIVCMTARSDFESVVDRQTVALKLH